MTRDSWLGKKCDIILTLSDYSTLLHIWEVWNLGLERKVGLFHTSTPHWSVELRMEKESKDLVASTGHLHVQPWPWNPEFLYFLLSSTLLRGVEVWKSLTKLGYCRTFPLVRILVILYSVPHFSEVRSVEVWNSLTNWV